MTVKGRWIVLGIIAAAIASVAYFNLTHDEAGTVMHNVAGDVDQSEEVTSKPAGVVGNEKAIETSQLPRMLELGSLG